MRYAAIFVLTAAVLAVAPVPAQAQLADPIPGPIPVSGVNIDVVPLVDGLTNPIWLVEPDETGRMFLVEQDGLVRIIQGGVLDPTPFLDVQSRLVNLNAGFDERGLLGLAFHPGYSNPESGGFGRLYTYTSEPLAGPADFTVPNDQAFNHQSVIAEWQVDPGNPDQVDIASRRELLRIDQPQGNHNGGTVIFGQDDMLYISLGDGGRSDDQGPGHVPGGNGQALDNVLGSILRIDPMGSNGVNGQYGVPADNPFVAADGLDEIWAYGLRNPYRMSFDRQTGELYIGDAGQNAIEEINIGQAGGNFGWRLKEGSFRFEPRGENEPGFVTDDLTGLPAGLIDPVFEYDHDEGVVVVGGFVYRGQMLAELIGQYIFGEFNGPGSEQGGRIFVGDPATGVIQELIPTSGVLEEMILAFGEDAEGELYVLTSPTSGPVGADGIVYRLVPEPASAAMLISGAAVLLWRRRR